MQIDLFAITFVSVFDRTQLLPSNHDARKFCCGTCIGPRLGSAEASTSALG
jgi:hypothetical protein